MKNLCGAYIAMQGSEACHGGLPANRLNVYPLDFQMELEESYTEDAAKWMREKEIYDGASIRHVCALAFYPLVALLIFTFFVNRCFHEESHIDIQFFLQKYDLLNTWFSFYQVS